MSLPQLRSWDILRITAILISRFLIDLQEANNGKHHQHSLSSVQLGQIATLDFNRVVGSLSSSLAAPGETTLKCDSPHLHLNQSIVEGDSDWLDSNDRHPKVESESGDATSSTVNPC